MKTASRWLRVLAENWFGRVRRIKPSTRRQPAGARARLFLELLEEHSAPTGVSLADSMIAGALAAGVWQFADAAPPRPCPA